MEANIRERATAGEPDAMEFKRTTGLRKEDAQPSYSTSSYLPFRWQWVQSAGKLGSNPPTKGRELPN